MGYNKYINILTVQDFENSVFYSDDELRKVDREFTFLYLYSMGLRHVKILAHDKQLSFYFVRTDTEPLYSNLLSGKVLPIPDFHMLTQGIEVWRNALVTMKTMRSEQRD
jgi:hypothetical protein